MVKSFADIIAKHDYRNSGAVIAMANPVDDPSIQAAIIIKEQYKIDSILVGDQDKITELLSKYSFNNL